MPQLQPQKEKKRNLIILFILCLWIFTFDLLLIINNLNYMTETLEHTAKGEIKTPNLFFHMVIIRNGIQDINN